MSNLLSTIENKITFATGLYAARDGDIAEVEEVYKAEYTVDQDAEDLGVTVVNVPTGQSQVKIHRAYLSLGLDVSTQVLKHADTATEEKAVTLLEKYLEAVWYENDSRTGARAYNDFVWYLLVRGAGVFKALFYPEHVGTKRFPIRILARDYRYVYPVFGDTDLLFVVEEYDRYAGDVKRELGALWDKRKDSEAVVWRMPNLSEYADTDEVEVVEYWDDTLKGLRVGGQWVWLTPHHYEVDGEGFIPYSFAWGEQTPLSDGKWKARSLLGPLKDVIRGQSKLISKLSTAIELFYYPQILVESPQGEAFVMSSAPGQVQPVPPGSKVTILNPTTNQMLVTTLMGWYEAAISLHGLAPVMWGVQPGQVQAGYAISLLQQGAKSKLTEKGQEIERAIAQVDEHVLKLTEVFAPLAEDGFHIYPAGKQRSSPLTITDADVGGHHRVRVSVTPQVPTDLALQWRIAGMARQPHPVTNLPVVSDAYIREEVVGLSHPDLEEARVIEEFLATHPEVREVQARMFVHQWMEEHAKEIRKLEKAEAKEQAAQIEDIEATILQAYQEALAKGEVPPALVPQPGVAPGMAAPPGPMPPGTAAPPGMPGMPPEMLPPSLEGRGPETAIPDEQTRALLERLAGRRRL